MTISRDLVTQLVIPVALVDVVLRLLHDTPSAGHPGRDRTLAAARCKYYWPTMRIDVEKHISQCLSCAQTKCSTSTAPILEYPLPAGPFDMVGIDHLQLPRSTQGSVYILVCVCVCVCVCVSLSLDFFFLATQICYFCCHWPLGLLPFY